MSLALLLESPHIWKTKVTSPQVCLILEKIHSKVGNPLMGYKLLYTVGREKYFYPKFIKCSFFLIDVIINVSCLL